MLRNSPSSCSGRCSKGPLLGRDPRPPQTSQQDVHARTVQPQAQGQVGADSPPVMCSLPAEERRFLLSARPSEQESGEWEGGRGGRRRRQQMEIRGAAGQRAFACQPSLRPDSRLLSSAISNCHPQRALCGHLTLHNHFLHCLISSSRPWSSQKVGHREVLL